MIPLGVMASARVAAAGGASFDFLNTYSSDTDASTFTFSSVDLGSAAADRVLIVYATWTTNQAFTSLTIGGVTATIDASYVTSPQHRAVIGRVSVPTGTTGDVVLTLGATAYHAGIAVWRSSGRTVTVADTATAYSLGVSSLSGVVTVTAGDVVVAGTAIRDAVRTTTWTGVDEDWDLSTMGAETDSWSGGHAVAASSGDLTVTAAYSSTGYASTLVVSAYSLS